MTDPKQTFCLTIAAAAAAHLIMSYTTAHDAASKALAAEVAAVPTAISTIVPVPKTERTVSGATSAKALGVPTLANANQRLDLAFCIDTTGSMGSEIDTIKQRVKAIVSEISAHQPHAQVRVALVAYRDQGDDYVTQAFNFDSNIDKFKEHLSALDAEGGGDTCEAVEQGVISSVRNLEWNMQKGTKKVLFVIGDAPPHAKSFSELTNIAREASRKGICINTIACDGFTGEGTMGEAAFQQIAALTNGKYQKLAYETEVAEGNGERYTIISEGSSYYKVKPGLSSEVRKQGGAELARQGQAALVSYDSIAPHLQGATNGTIGPQSRDASNLDAMVVTGATRALDEK